MVGDLTGVGQVFGNLGHFILSFASQMPGLAEVLLKVLDDVTRLAAAAVDSRVPHPCRRDLHHGPGMGLEEFNRWGSLAVSGLGKIGWDWPPLDLSGKTGSYFLVGDRFVGILKNLYRLPAQRWRANRHAGFSKIPVLGEALIGTTEDIEAAKAATLGWIGRLSALATSASPCRRGIGFLAYKMVRPSAEVRGRPTTGRTGIGGQGIGVSCEQRAHENRHDATGRKTIHRPRRATLHAGRG